MARKFLTAIDLTKNELQNPRAHFLAAAPSSPVEGQFYYDSVAHKLYYYNGTSWIATDGTSLFATPNLTLGTANAAGSANTVIRSDATILAFDATNPTTSAVADAAAVGSATVAARRDHKHAREAFASPTAETTFGSSSAAGSATTLPRSDHTHGNPTHVNADHSAINRSALAVPTADVSWGNFKITSLADPTAAQDAATKAYVDAVKTGLDVKASVRVATTANGTLATAYENGDTIDGVVLATGDRILLKDQSTGAENGIYTVNASGAPTRAIDADANAEVTSGMFTFVTEGTTNGDSGWVLTTNDPITVGSTALVFAQFSGAGQITAGTGMSKTGNTLNVGAGAAPGSGGPGGGLVANADDLVIDTAIVVRKYATSIGDGAALAYVVTHNLNTQDVMVRLRDNSSPFAYMEPDFEATSVNTVTVRFTVAPTTNQYRCIVFG